MPIAWEKLLQLPGGRSPQRLSFTGPRSHLVFRDALTWYFGWGGRPDVPRPPEISPEWPVGPVGLPAPVRQTAMTTVAICFPPLWGEQRETRNPLLPSDWPRFPPLASVLKPSAAKEFSEWNRQPGNAQGSASVAHWLASPKVSTCPWMESIRSPHRFKALSGFGLGSTSAENPALRRPVRDH